MAPPSSRRSSGHSRKAQYSAFTGYFLAMAGALVGAALLAFSWWQPAAFSEVRGGASDIISPVGEATGAARNGSRGFFDELSAYWKAGSQNAELRKQVEINRIRIAEAEAIKQENARLRALLDLAENEVEPVATARLIGSSAASSRRFAYVGVGSRAGVEIGMPVRSPRGVIGRILEVARSSSRVLLLTDSESVLPVRRANDETVAFAEGRGDGLLNVRLINLGINPLEVGDVFVTSGAGGYYRPGVAVAVLIKKTSDGGVARLISEPAGTDFVAVDPIWQPDAVESAETPIEQEIGD